MSSDIRVKQVDGLVGRIEAFIREHVIPLERDPRIDSHGPSDALVNELREKARAADVLTPHILSSEARGGFTHLETARVLRAAGYSPLGPVALNCMSPDEGNMYMLEKVATPEQKARFLEPLVEGRIRSTFLMTEPDGGAGSDPSMLATTAKPDGNHWVINGRKTFSTGAKGAAFAIVMARTERSATMFLVDMNSPGMKLDRVLDTIDNAMPGGHGEMTLENVRVPADQILGDPDQGFRYAQIRLAPARLTHCMRWWGTVRRAQDVALEYARKRQAFGKPLIDHEGVGFMLADNEIDLHQALLMIDWCAGRLDEGIQGTTESSVAKVAVSEALYRIADRCVQVLGGLGITRDTIVEQAFRETRAFRIYDGPSEVHRWSLAKKLKTGGLGL